MEIDTNQIVRMSREEKLLIMEAIWADLSRTESAVESPRWHEGVLNKTDERLASGKEQLVDWDDAKRELRKRFD